MEHFQKLTIASLLIVRLIIMTQMDDRERWIDNCLSDVGNCEICFDQDELDHCLKYIDDIELTPCLGGSVNDIFGYRQTQFGSTKGNSVILKHIADEEKVDAMINELCGSRICSVNDIELYAKIKKTIIETERVDGIQRCANVSSNNFERIFNTFPTKTIFWTQVYLNSELVMLRAIANLDVNEKIKKYATKIIDSAGFVLVETNAGKSLNQFYDEPFEIRLVIAKNLLHAAEAFSYGFGGMRIYLTDLTGDNIVVDEQTLNVAFIDLDNVVVVDSNPQYHHLPATETLLKWDTIHVHEKIECDGCFAYVPNDMCSHHLSDLNIFAVCQLLLEDLNGNVENGFLHSVPDQILFEKPSLIEILLNCYDCQSTAKCNSRFDTIEPIVKKIDSILKL